MHPSRAITLLHISDTQFGRNHRFGRLGLPEPDAPFDTLFARLRDNLRLLKDKHGLVPDLVIASGDLAEWGKKKQFDDVLDLLTRLTEVLGLARERVVIVPGNHDINRDSCKAYFANCEADDETPVAPYWPKWKHFAQMFRTFYGDAASIQFTPDEPWSWYEYDDLKLVVAGLNSTMAESHLEKDHHGYLGEKQLRWFADKLKGYESQGWFRLGVMHHNQKRGVPSDDESLHDADDLRGHLGGSLNLLLHGHTHEGKVHLLERNVPILSTGSAAVTAEARPEEIPNQYQVLRLHPDRIERYTLCYDPRGKRWIGDNRGSEQGDAWITEIRVSFEAVASLSPAAYTMPPVDELGSLMGWRLQQPRPPEFVPRRDDLLSRVEEVCRIRKPGAQITRAQAVGLEYLRVTETDGVYCHQYPVGVAEAGLTPDYLAHFLAEVHRPYRGADPGVTSQIVYPAMDRPSPALIDDAGRQGVRVMSLIEYQGLIDFRAYLERQTRRLENDPIYPPSLYVEQCMDCEMGGDRFDSEDALETVAGWLSQPEPRFVLLLGDFGTGKSFLLHMLALQLAMRDEGPTPVLIQMRGLQKARILDELVAQHLVGAGEDRVDVKAFRSMLEWGRIALFFDGFDELALRVTYEGAAQHFDTLIEGAAGQAKIVTTSRTQHFESEHQIKSALAVRAQHIPGRRIGRLKGFAEPQIRRFLVNRYGNEPEADARLSCIRDIRDLSGLAANPRMLGFIADLPAEQLHEVREGKGEITSAVLYRMLIERWLANEHKRAEPRGAGPALSLHGLWEAVTQLALRLWQQAESSVRPGDLRDEAALLIPRLAVADLDPATAAHQLGSGTLLVRDQEGRFRFIHQSVMEWLVARRAAETLATGDVTALLGRRELSPLMADFLVALSVEPGTALRDWVGNVLGGAATDGEVIKKNALTINERLGDHARLSAKLAGQDLRGHDLSGRRDLRKADLRAADLSEARLAGADLTETQLGDAKLVRADLSRAILRNADLARVDGTGASLLGAYLWGATLTGGRWPLAKLVGARINPDALADCDLWGAALPQVTRVDFQNSFADACASVCWHPSHSLLASGHQSGSVRLWDAESGHELRRFEGHGSVVRSVAFSPDGRRLASGTDDQTVRLWEVESGRALHTLEGHGDLVLSVAFSPDGKCLASGSADTTVRLWDPLSGRTLRTLEGHGYWVFNIAFSPDGKTLATAGGDWTVRLWNRKSGIALRTLEGHGELVRSVAFSPDGNCLASGSGDKTVRLWDPVSGRTLRTLEGHGKAVESVAFSPDGNCLASGSGDKTVRLWDPVSGRALRTLEGYRNPVLSVAFRFDGRCLASGSGDKTVRLWDVESGHELRRFEGHGSVVRSVAFSPDGRRLASGTDDQTVRLWDVESGRELRRLEGHGNSVLSVAFSPNDRHLASGDWDKTVRVWDVESGRALRTLAGHGYGVLSVAFSLDGKRLASGSGDKSVRLWDPESGRALRILVGHGKAVRSVTFSPDGQWLASGSDDKTVRLWDVESGRELRRLEEHGDSVLNVAFSPDDRHLASGGRDNTVRLWDAGSGRALRTLEGHGNSVLSVAFSPDGKCLASGSWDNTVRLWDVESGRTLRTLKGHGYGVLSVAFSPDGRHVATGSADETMRLWDVESGTLLATLICAPEGWAAVTPDGRYKLGGDTAGSFWFAIGLCRFEPGELDPYLPERLRRLAPEEPIL